MYLPHLLNNNGLFPRAATLWKDPKYAQLVTDILSRATAAVVSIHRIDHLQRECFKEFELFEEQIENLEESIVFNSESMVALQNEIPPLLTSLRIMQDLGNDLVRRLSGIEIPRSISDTINKIEKYNLPQELKDLYLRYWNECGGGKLRDYRNSDQHYANIVDHVFLKLSPVRNVLIMFPDNPETKSKKKFTYNERICGISVLRIGFDEIHDFIEGVLAYYEIETSMHCDSIGMDQLGDLRPYRHRALSLHFQTKLTQTGNEPTLYISAIRLSQLENGKLEIQTLSPSEEKIKELNERLSK